MNDLQLLKKRANVKRLFDTIRATAQPETVLDLAYVLAECDRVIALRKMAVPA